MRWRGLKAWAARISDELLLLAHALRDPETPRWLRWVGLALVAYALSPVDLIPDFIPLLGWLDDLIILPLGLAWLRRHLPPAVLARASAQLAAGQLPQSLRMLDRLGRWWRWGLALVALALLLALALGSALIWLLWRALAG